MARVDRRSVRWMGSTFSATGRGLRRLAPDRWTIVDGVVIGVVLILGVSGLILFAYPDAYHSGQPEAWQAIFNLAGFIVFLGSIVAVIPVARHNIDTDDAFAAGLVATAALIPTTVTEFTTVAAYAAPHVLGATTAPQHDSWVIWVHNLALLIGASAGIVAWLFWGMFNRHLVLVNRQNAGVYAKLRERYMELRSAYDILVPAVAETNASLRIARVSLWKHLRFLAQELSLRQDIHPPNETTVGDDPAREVNPANGVGALSGESPERRAGLRWVLATGYLDLWDHLHDAEEELIQFRPEVDLVRSALDDQRRLQGSNLPNSDQLLSTLRQAIVRIKPDSAPYFQPAGPMSTTHAVRDQGQETDTTPETARVALRYVRHTINQFRSSSARELVRRRNHLLEAVVFTRITSYGLLGLAIVVGTQPKYIFAATVFYLVGALTGLFSRLRLAPTEEAAVEDYGLASATLVQVTPFSGLAAVGGVLVMGMLGPVLSASQGGATHPGASGLGEIFSLNNPTFGIVVSAVFGLTPSLLISRLERTSEQFRSNLRSTEPHAATAHPS